MVKPDIYQNRKPTELITSKFYGIIFFIIILIGTIYNYAFDNGKMICDNYIFNSYLYLILSTTIIFSVVIANEHTHFYSSIIKAYKYQNILVPISIIIIQLYLISFLKNKLKNEKHENLYKIHIYWFLINVIIGLFIIPIMYFANVKHVANPLLLVFILWSIIMLFKNIMSTNGFHINWTYVLSICLIIFISSLIILPPISYYFNNSTNYVDITNSILKIETIIILVLLLLTNHIAIEDNDKKCIENKMTPNYPEESFDFFILIKNIISDFSNRIGICKYEYRKY